MFPDFSVVDVIIAKFISSIISDVFVFSFASFALVNIPLSPLSAAIVTPAKISNTIILITSAISVIPFDSFFFAFI